MFSGRPAPLYSYTLLVPGILASQGSMQPQETRQNTEAPGVGVPEVPPLITGRRESKSRLPDIEDRTLPPTPNRCLLLLQGLSPANVLNYMNALSFLFYNG